MSDSDIGSKAWSVTPSDYLKSRSRNFRVPSQPFSLYVTMRDSVRLAVDVFLPQPLKPEGAPLRFPTIVILTPYYRRFKITDSAAEPSPNTAKYRDAFVPYGYAVVVVDVRGTGARFGTRDSMRSPRERDDSFEIARWIVAQSWSDGSIGSTGISYLGAAACFLASTGHPGVKAIAPLFAVSDIYSEQLYPGGLLSQILTNAYDDLMAALDQDLRGSLAKYAYFNDPRFDGPQPVDSDLDGSVLRQAIEVHRDNFKLRDLAREFFFRDSALIHDPALTSAACSPYGYVDKMPPDVAVLSVSGWYDGAGYTNGALSRYLTLDRRSTHPQRLLLGPWDHGARTNVSPWRETPTSQFQLMAELLRFFDRYLLHRDSGLEREAPVHYFSIHDNQWHAAEQWPPGTRDWRLYATAQAELVETAQAEDGALDYQVRFTTTTGTRTRYERLGAANIENYYPDWKERSAGMLHLETRPLAKATQITGNAVARLTLASSEPDASIFVYLSEVEADGSVRYITEGMLRLLHRAEAESPPDYKTSWPFHPCTRAAAHLMPVGIAETISIAAIAVSWTLSAGSRLRISISGADAEHFPQVPHGRPPKLRIVTGEAGGSCFEIPVGVTD